MACVELRTDPSGGVQDKSILYIALLGQGSMVPLVVKLGSDVKRKHYKATGEDLRTFIDDGLSQGGPGAAAPKPCTSSTRALVARPQPR